MAGTDSILGILPKNPWEWPFAFWNLLGLGLFLLFSSYGYNFESLQQVDIQYTVLFSVFISLLITGILMVLFGAWRLFFVYFLEHKNEYDPRMLFELSAVLTIGFSIAKWGSRVTPYEPVTYLGLLIMAGIILIPIFD